MRLSGRVAIVTGGGLGIGRSYCLGLAREGAKIVIADIDLQASELVAMEIKKNNGDALAVRTDVSDEGSTVQMAEKAAGAFGRIDILINNASLFTALGAAKAWDELDPKEWDRVMSINVKGPWLCAKAVFPHMKAQGKGKIINISSGVAFKGSPARLHYGVSKGAVLALTKTLAVVLGKHNIHVNTIAPGSTLSEGVIKRESGTTLQAQIRAQRCIQRDMYPDDLVGAAVFLASDESDMITGQTIVVDGGSVML